MSEHGHCARRADSPTYITWRGMVERCTNPRTARFHRYGGRGVKVCERWRKFENFLADMGERPQGMTLDRFPNRDGNYEPGNCRWATAREQAANTDRSVAAANAPIGKRFGSWVVIGSAGRAAQRILWTCRCDCGTAKAVRKSHLVGGKSLSCGCGCGRKAA